MDRLSWNLASDACPWPASILLAPQAHVAASRNETTARAKRYGFRGNSTVEVTFWIADPPTVSYYNFHCTKAPNSNSDLDSGEADEPPQIKPQVVGAEGRFVLLSTLFPGRCSYEYFMYKGDPKSPSLESLPLLDGDFSLRRTKFAIVPRGDDGHYLLIAIGCRVNMKYYRLHIYSSEDATWTTKELPDPCPEILIIPDKVFVIRDGLLLWVDLLKGMLLCDVLQEPHHAQYIPLPEPLPANREQVKQIQREVRRIRDLTCVDGVIKFIEMELREIVREITDGVPEKPIEPIDPRTKDVLYDSDLIKVMTHKPVELETWTEVSADGWSAMTWTREIGSNCWLKERIVDVNDILVDDSVFSGPLSGQSQPESAKSLTFKDLYSAWPTLSADGNDVLYLKSHNESRGGGGAVVAVDLAEKTLKVEAPEAHPFGIYLYGLPCHMLRPCALGNHLKKIPGIKVSASQIARTGNSANVHREKAGQPAGTCSSPSEPNNTAIRVGEPDSYESDNKRPRRAPYSVH